MKTQQPEIQTDAYGKFRVYTVKGVNFTMRYIEPGNFLMGASPQEVSDAGQHKVTIKRGYWIMETLVTQELYEAVTGENPSHFKGDSQLPVESVNWFDAKKFAKKLSKITGGKFKLPHEEQWEYAARAGTQTIFPFGDAISDKLANYDATYTYKGSPKGKCIGKTTPVKTYKPNAWGLHDMAGNLWEWCRNELYKY